MKKPGRILTAIVSVPFLTGCFTLLPAPLPNTLPERQALDVRGVVLQGAGGEQVEFEEIVQVEWTNTTVSFVGRQVGEEEVIVDRTFSLSEVESVLVREIDPGGTSAVIGGLVVGLVGVLMFVVNNSDPRAG